MNEQEQAGKPTMNMGAALCLARELGAEYRAARPGEDWSIPDNRFRMDESGNEWDDGGDGERALSPEVPAVIIRPAKREVSLIDALHWAAQDESREFRIPRFPRYRYRVNNDKFQHRHDEGCEWETCGVVSANWCATCTIDEGWEDVTAQVRVVVE